MSGFIVGGENQIFMKVGGGKVDFFQTEIIHTKQTQHKNPLLQGRK